MRETLEHYQQDGATVRIEFDTGGPVGARHLVIVDGDGYLVNRWFYFDEFNEHYARNFAEKIIRDENYRDRSLEGTADWKQVADIYEPAARRVFDIFQDAGLIGYTSGDEAEEARYRDAKQTWETLCEEIFREVKQRIRNDEPLDELDTFIDQRVERARTKATELTA